MDDQPKAPRTFIITMLGESTVGKTSIVNVYVGTGFSDNYIATIGLENICKEIQIESGEKIKVKIWDTAGQERFKSISQNTIKNCKGVVVVFDLTNKISFEKVTDWIEQVRELTTKVPICLFGNKSDLSNREVTQEEIDKLCKDHNLVYFETSAKNNTGITEGFNKMANLSYQIFGNINQNILLRKTEKRPKKKKCC